MSAATCSDIRRDNGPGDQIDVSKAIKKVARGLSARVESIPSNRETPFSKTVLRACFWPSNRRHEQPMLFPQLWQR